MMFSRENSNVQATAILPKKIKVNNVSEGVENLSKVTNINYISSSDDLDKSSTVLQFILTSMCQAMDLKSK